jgi:hypothetical protein
VKNQKTNSLIFNRTGEFEFVDFEFISQCLNLMTICEDRKISTTKKPSASTVALHLTMAF